MPAVEELETLCLMAETATDDAKSARYRARLLKVAAEWEALREVAEVARALLLCPGDYESGMPLDATDEWRALRAALDAARGTP